jgi:hypothetical protein
MTVRCNCLLAAWHNSRTKGVLATRATPIRPKIRKGLRRHIELSSFVVPPVDGVIEAITVANEHKMIAGAVASNGKRLSRKSTPATCNLGFPQKVICGPSDTLPIGVIEHWMKLPCISGRLDLSTVLRTQTSNKSLRQRTPKLMLGALNKLSINRKSHDPDSGG